MKFDLGEVFTRMWKIGWNHKVLWLWQMMPRLLGIVLLPIFFLFNPNFFLFGSERTAQLINEPWRYYAYNIIVLVLMVPFSFLRVLAQSATTYGAVQADRENKKISFTESLYESAPYFWRIFGLYAIFIGSFFAIWLSIMAIFVIAMFSPLAFIAFCILPIFFLLIPVFVVGYSILELAQVAVISDNMGTLNAISYSWKLFRQNVVGLVLLVVLLYVAMYIFLTALSFPMVYPMMIILTQAQSQAGASTLLPFSITILYSLVFFVSSIFQGILMAFFKAAWAVVFIRINHTNLSTNMEITNK